MQSTPTSQVLFAVEGPGLVVENGRCPGDLGRGALGTHGEVACREGATEDDTKNCLSIPGEDCRTRVSVCVCRCFALRADPRAGRAGRRPPPPCTGRRGASSAAPAPRGRRRARRRRRWPRRAARAAACPLRRALKGCVARRRAQPAPRRPPRTPGGVSRVPRHQAPLEPAGAQLPP